MVIQEHKEHKVRLQEHKDQPEDLDPQEHKELKVQSQEHKEQQDQQEIQGLKDPKE